MFHRLHSHRQRPARRTEMTASESGYFFPPRFVALSVVQQINIVQAAKGVASPSDRVMQCFQQSPAVCPSCWWRTAVALTSFLPRVYVLPRFFFYFERRCWRQICSQGIAVIFLPLWSTAPQHTLLGWRQRPVSLPSTQPVMIPSPDSGRRYYPRRRARCYRCV